MIDMTVNELLAQLNLTRSFEFN